MVDMIYPAEKIYTAINGAIRQVSPDYITNIWSCHCDQARYICF